jgi:autotransporter-associated beta strand protein
MAAPTGLPSVVFYAGGSPTGTPLTVAPVNAGTYTAIATYSGDANYAAAQSTAATFTIIGAPLVVPAANWTSAGLTLTLGSDGNLHVYTTGTTTDAVTLRVPGSVGNVQVTAPGSATAELTIDSTNGNPIPAGGLSYSGGGGLIKTGPGSVTLSQTNTYTGGTAVQGGTLIATCSGAVPSGGSLTVGAGGVFVFDPAATAATIASTTASATPAIAAGAVQGLAAGDSPAGPVTVGETQAGPLAAVVVSSGSSIATMPVAPRHSAAIAATSRGRADAAVAHDTVIARRYTGDSAAAEAWWSTLSSRGQDHKKPAAIQALDAVWAAYGAE